MLRYASAKNDWLTTQIFIGQTFIGQNKWIVITDYLFVKNLKCKKCMICMYTMIIGGLIDWFIAAISVIFSCML